jgi:hypothetical protein
MLNPRFVSEP